MTGFSNNDIARAIYLSYRDKKGEEIREVCARVVKFLHRKRLLSKKRDILERLEKIANAENGVVSAKVRSARVLSNDTKERIRLFLKERYKSKETNLEEITDERLIGGVKIETNEEVMDLSIKNKIKKLQEYLSR